MPESSSEFSRSVEDDEKVQDIGELLGFRITGGRDFFMPITIFHVNIITMSLPCVAGRLINGYVVCCRR
jgi:hypothetical protein